MNKSGDILSNELEAGMAKEVADISKVAGDQVIHRHHRMAFGDEMIAEMASNESGAAGN